MRLSTKTRLEPRLTEIEESSQLGNEQEDSKREELSKVDAKSITINNIPMGDASSPYEVLQIQREGKLVSIVIIYDTGSEVTLCNDETGPMITNTKEEKMRIAITTINSEWTIPMQNCKLSLNNGQTIEAVKIPNMNFRLQPQIIPDQWQDLQGAWANQDTYGVTAQILLGAD